MQAAIYTRVSTEDQAHGYSLSTQVAECRRCATESGFQVAEDLVLIEDGQSGATLDRPKLRELRDAVAARRCDAVIVYDPDRLSRRLVDLLLLDDEFRARRVALIFVKHPIEASGEGTLFFQLRGAFAEYERSKILERTRRGILARARAGLPPGGQTPFGYAPDIVNGKRQGFVINEAEARTVRLAYQLCVDGLNITQIMSRLNELGLAPRSGKPWQRSSVHNILAYKGYLGESGYGKRQTVGKGPGKVRVRRPEKEWIPFYLPPIVDAATCEAVRRQLALNSQKAKRNANHDYLLSGRIYCGVCGHRMYGIHSKGIWFYYRCCQKGINKPGCRNSHINAVSADNAIWADVHRILQQPELVIMEIERELRTQKTIEQIETELALVAAGVKDAERQHNQLLQAYLADAIDLAILKAKGQSLMATKDNLLQRQADLGQRLASARQRVDLAVIEAFFERVRSRLYHLTIDEKKEALALLDVHVVWTGSTLDLTAAVPVDIASKTPSKDRSSK